MGTALAQHEWMQVHATIHLIYKIVASDHGMYREMQAHVVMCAYDIMPQHIPHEMDITAITLRLLQFLAHGSQMSRVTTGTQSMSDDATDNITQESDDSIVIRAIQSCVGILLASARVDPRAFVRQLLLTLSDSASTSTSSSTSTRASTASSSSFTHMARSLLHIESRHGIYSGTLGLLQLLSLIIPHHQRWSVDRDAHLQHVASLDVHVIIKWVCTDCFVTHDAWRYRKRCVRGSMHAMRVHG